MAQSSERRRSRSDGQLREQRKLLERQWMTNLHQVVDVTDADIARRAYDLFEQRGSRDGHDVDDWLEAERELRPALSSTAA